LVDPAIRVIWTVSRFRPISGRTLANGWLALDLAAQIPPSDLVVATYAPTAVPALLGAARRRSRSTWLYADYVEMFESRPIERWIVQHLASRFERVLTYSTASAEEVLRNGARQAIVIGLGLPSEDLLCPPVDTKARSRTALYVGDSRPRKGLADFLDASEMVKSHVPDLELTIVTKDDAQVRTRLPHRVIRRPTDAQLVELYKACGVFVSTSWFEGLGLPPLQAMACGAPVVVTDQRGARDYAVNEQNCLIVPIKSPDAVAEAMVRILRDPGRAQRLGAAGIETARNYRWDSAVDRFEAALGIGSRGQTERVGAG
jgi:glycosyltransferase involved in cell wall biosynthesis